MAVSAAGAEASAAAAHREDGSMSMVDRLIPESDRERIRAAVAAVELKTSGEVVPLITESSDDYAAAGWRASVAFGLIGAAVLTFLLGPVRVWGGLSVWDLWIFPAAFVAFAALAGGLVTLFPILKSPFITRAEKNNAIGRATLSEFMLNGLGKTRDRTGILIYISLLEHRVQVFADEGINAKVDPGTWEEVVATIVAGIKARRATDALIEALQYCGEILAKHAPPRPDDTNELKNLIIK